MERAPIVVAAAVIAVIAGAGVKILSDRTIIDTGLEVDGGRPGDGAPDWSSDDPASLAHRGSESGSRDGGPGWPGASGDRTSHSTARAAGGVRREPRPDGPAHEAGRRIERRRANGLASSADSGGRRHGDNSEIMDFLGSRSAGANPQPSDQPGGDVALEVLTAEDSSKAVYKEGVFEPDDGGDGLKFSENAQLTFAQAGGASGEAGTISFDVEPDWSGSDRTDNSLVQIRAENQWANRLQLVKNGRYLRFILSDDTGREADISVPIDDWVPGESHGVTASWGDGRTSLFLDGRLAGSNTYDGQFDIAPDTPLYVGSDFRNSDYHGAAATIRGFTLFKSAQHP
jgi:Concanavalin A-like lectin/glucanases superfamily